MKIEVNTRLFELEQNKIDDEAFIETNLDSKRIFVECLDEDNLNKFIKDKLDYLWSDRWGVMDSVERYKKVLPIVSYAENLKNSDPSLCKYIKLNDSLDWEVVDKSYFLSKI